jgi:hypothetical protein
MLYLLNSLAIKNYYKFGRNLGNHIRRLKTSDQD